MPLAMKLNNCDLGVAEGSWLTLRYLLCRWWVLIFIDTKQLGNNSQRTEYGNQFNGSEITNEQELLTLLQLAVPSHGLILRPSKSEYYNFVLQT
jgi:hypothetical protein